MGELALVPDADDASLATFKGDIDYAGEEKLNFIYPGKNTVETDGGSTISIATQAGTLAGLTGQDVLTATAEVRVFEGDAQADLGVMDRKLAFGRFRLSFLSDVDASEAAVITVTGTGVKTSATLSWSGDMAFEPTTGEGIVSVNATDASADFYLAVIPQEGIEPTFSVTLSDGSSYTGTLAARDWKAGEYVRKGDDDESFSAITVEMTKSGGETVELPQGVGPVITLDGKKWQFVDGNLWYDVDKKQYGIYESQAYYIYKFGKGVISRPATYGSAYLGYDKIDHFSWGATGIGNYTQDPQTVCKTGGNSTEDYNGTHYPFVNDDVVGGNSYFTNLLNPVSMDLREADFGYAYMTTGRHSSDKREYITPPLEAFKQVFGNGNVIQGCTIEGAGIDGNNVTGLIVIPNMTLTDVKAKIKEIGCNYTSSLDKLLHNNSGNTFNVTAITLKSCDDLKKLNNALFFPAAGHGSLAAEQERKGYTSFSKVPGHYWSADANQGSWNVANGKSLYFSNMAGFFYNNASGSSSYTRHGKLSVRLLVEVKE